MQVSGVILSGGKSSRMDENKAFVRVGGRRLIDIIVEKLNRHFHEVIIVTNEPEIYQELGTRVVTDIIPGKGPLSGLHAGLAYSRFEAAFVVACDMPFIDMNLARYMVAMLPGCDVVAPRVRERFQPLFAVYSRSCLPVFERCLVQDKLKISRVYQEELKVKYITEEDVLRFGDPEVIFCNVNSRENLSRAQEIAGRMVI